MSLKEGVPGLSLKNLMMTWMTSLIRLFSLTNKMNVRNVVQIEFASREKNYVARLSDTTTEWQVQSVQTVLLLLLWQRSLYTAAAAQPVIFSHSQQSPNLPQVPSRQGLRTTSKFHLSQIH